MNGKHQSWVYHPFNRVNNINGIDGDPNGDGEGTETHTLQIPAVTKLQCDLTNTNRVARTWLFTIGDTTRVWKLT